MNTTHMGLCFSRLFQSWEVEAFYHTSSSRLFLPPPLLPTHPQRPDDSPSQFPSSQGRLDMGPSAGYQCQRVSQTVSLPAQRAGLHSAAAHQPSLRQGKDYLPAFCVCFFLFLWKKSRVTIFSILSSPVDGKLLNWGRQQQQQKASTQFQCELPFTLMRAAERLPGACQRPWQ